MCRIDHSDCTIGKIIGKGAFSTVHIGRYFGDLVAIKKQIRDQKDLDDYLLRELAVLKNINHANLVAYIGAWNESNQKGVLQQNTLYIVTEYCQGGDLQELLLSNTLLSWGFRFKMAHDTISGLVYLHSHHLIHRDIKSPNILLDKNWTCKISDFGMAKTFEGGTDHTKKRMTYCGTEPYMAPELLFEEEYGVEADIFSYGMMLLEIMKRVKVGEDGFGVRPPAKMFHLDEELTRSQMPPDVPDSLLVMALQCVSYESSDRPSGEEIVDWLLDLMEEEPLSNSDLPVLPAIPQVDDVSQHIAHSKPVSDVKTIEKVPPLVKARTMNAVDLLDTTVKSGYLHKRKSASLFSVWRQRWFVLTKNHLSWYGSRDDMVVRRGRIGLRGVKIRKTVQLRFVILNSKDNEEYDADIGSNKYAHREFSASCEEDLNDWIECINLVAGLHVQIPVSKTDIDIKTPNKDYFSKTCLSEQDSMMSLNSDLSPAGDDVDDQTAHAIDLLTAPEECESFENQQLMVGPLKRASSFGTADADITVSNWLDAIGLLAEYGETFKGNLLFK